MSYTKEQYEAAKKIVDEYEREEWEEGMREAESVSGYPEDDPSMFDEDEAEGVVSIDPELMDEFIEHLSGRGSVLNSGLPRRF